LVRFFNPRRERWSDHFRLLEGQILAKTEIGEATAKILDFNAPERILRRRLLIKVGRYPGKNPA